MEVLTLDVYRLYFGREVVDVVVVVVVGGGVVVVVVVVVVEVELEVYGCL